MMETTDMAFGYCAKCGKPIKQIMSTLGGLDYHPQCAPGKIAYGGSGGLDPYGYTGACMEAKDKRIAQLEHQLAAANEKAEAAERAVERLVEEVIADCPAHPPKGQPCVKTTDQYGGDICRACWREWAMGGDSHVD